MKLFSAMLLDSYRQLNSKKLFWVILALSGIIVLFYGSIGFDQNGMFFFFGLTSIESELLVDGSPLARILYRSIFSTFILSIWLAWVATILALVSTTTIFPDFIASGAIDMVLSKPVARWKLFVMKYITSLLFVVLQVGLFCIGVFLCMGLRIGDWDARIFLAIPLVTLFFSYLYSFNVLIGVWTRSGLAALLLTLLLWVSIWSLNTADGIVSTFHMQAAVRVDRANERIAALDGQDDAAATLDRDQLVIERDNDQRVIDALDPYVTALEIVRFPLPKTALTIDLLDRYLSRDDDVSLLAIMGGQVQRNPDGTFSETGNRNVDTEAQARMIEEERARSPWVITGTSLGFEFVMIGLACFIFTRRDF